MISIPKSFVVNSQDKSFGTLSQKLQWQRERERMGATWNAEMQLRMKYCDGSTSSNVHFMSWNFNYYDYHRNDIHTSCSHHCKEKLPHKNCKIHELMMTMSFHVKQAKQQPLTTSKHWCHPWPPAQSSAKVVKPLRHFRKMLGHVLKCQNHMISIQVSAQKGFLLIHWMGLNL